jgi:LPS-assembly lipoprotein
VLAGAAAALLGGCGFKLRGAGSYAFATLYAGFEERSALGSEFRRTLASSGGTRVVADPRQAQALLDVLLEQRDKLVLGTTAAGQTREFQLRLRLRFKLRAQDGRELIPETELLVTRDVSFNESAVLAKEGEEQLLYRSMQTDMVAQLLRRLEVVRSL